MPWNSPCLVGPLWVALYLGVRFKLRPCNFLCHLRFWRQDIRSKHIRSKGRSTWKLRSYGQKFYKHFLLLDLKGNCFRFY